MTTMIDGVELEKTGEVVNDGTEVFEGNLKDLIKWDPVQKIEKQ